MRITHEGQPALDAHRAAVGRLHRSDGTLVVREQDYLLRERFSVNAATALDACRRAVAGIGILQAMAQERRQTARRKFLVECSWTRDAVITDLGRDGCYVDARITPKVGDVVEFTTTLGDHVVLLRGIAVTSTSGVGFGVKFDDLPDETTKILGEVLERAGRTS